MSTVKIPVARKIEKTLTIHGDTRVDPYYWLNDRSNPEVIAYLEAENNYTNQILAPVSQLREDLYNEIVGRIKQTDMSVPYRFQGYEYLTEYHQGQEHPLYLRKKVGPRQDKELMLDVNELAANYDFYQVGGRNISPDNQLLAFGEDTVSRRIYTLRFKDLSTGEFLSDRIEGTTGSVAWADDSNTVFYTRKDSTLRPHKIYRHVLGTDPANDEEVFHESDDTFYTTVYRSRSGKYIIIASVATLSTEFRVLRADQPQREFRIIQPRERKHEYFISHIDDRFYIRTNWEAQNFRLMVMAENGRDKNDWDEVIPHRSDVLLEDVDLFRDYLVLSERSDGITRIRIRPWTGQPGHYIEFDEAVCMAYTMHNYEQESQTLRLFYTSLKTPTSTYDYDMTSRTLHLRKQQEVVGAFDKDAYVTERINAEAEDGTRVPISLVYRKEFKKNGLAPLLLYGYGSYGHSIDPYFNSARLSLLDRGFVFAIAHIRGGEEMGRHWYEAGKLLQKKNTFTDFIDCAQYLISEKYTSKEHLYAMGGSAGGLLMGAVVNLAPQLFNGVIAAVPFVDVVTTMLDDSIPLTTGEYDEWGNPNDPQFYQYIKSYSPYDNVVARDYPAMLVTTGLHDSQVQYWEPAKWVAKMRALRTNDRPLLLHTNMEAGHSGASGRFRRHRETALDYAFLLFLEQMHQ